MSAVSARQAGREAAARAVVAGARPLRKGTTSARHSLMSPPREGLADISNGCVRPCEPRGAAWRAALRSAPRGAPERETILSSPEFFAGLDYPALVHCKSGADRAGFVAALYLLVHENKPLDEAMRQLGLRFGHFRFAKTGILDAFFERYRSEGQAKGIPFIEWAADIYDPVALERDFRPGRFSTFLVDSLLRRE